MKWDELYRSQSEKRLQTAVVAHMEKRVTNVHSVPSYHVQKHEPSPPLPYEKIIALFNHIPCTTSGKEGTHFVCLSIQ